MSRSQRLLLFAMSMAILALAYFWGNASLPTDSTIATILISSLILMAFSTLFLEHWFTRPTDALAAALSVLLLLAPARAQLGNTGIWYDLLSPTAR